MKSRQNVITSSPDTPAPAMVCPHCDRPLLYRHTVIGGVSPVERWDHYLCVTCGPFEYRHRTRRLRAVDRAVARLDR